MAAPNFYKRNASRYFCIGRNRYFTQEDIDELELPQDMLGQFDKYGTQDSYDWTKSILMDELKKAGYWEPESYDRLDYETHAGSAYLAKTRIEFHYAGADFYIDIKVRENGGYYNGSCLDYDISLSGCNDVDGDFDLYEEVTGDTEIDPERIADYNVCGNQGMSRLQSKNIARRISKEIAKAVDELELIFSRNCDDELYLDWCCNYGGFVGEAGYAPYPTRLYEERKAA